MSDAFMCGCVHNHHERTLHFCSKDHLDAWRLNGSRKLGTNSDPRDLALDLAEKALERITQISPTRGGCCGACGAGEDENCGKNCVLLISREALAACRKAREGK